MTSVSSLNSQIEKYKQDWLLANQRGDQKAMDEAHRRAEQLRSMGGTLGANQDTAATLALKQQIQQSGVHVSIGSYSVAVANKGIVQAKLDYQYAQARGDQNAMSAASQVADNYRAMGGTIAASTSLVDAKKQMTTYQNTPSLIKNITPPLPTNQSLPATTNNHTTPTIVQFSYMPSNGNDINRVNLGQDGNLEDPWYQPVSSPNQDYVQVQNENVEQDKIDYINAQVRGDTGAMQRAATNASSSRAAGATLGAGDDTAVTTALKNYYSSDSTVMAAVKSKSTDDLNKAILKAKNDYAYAQAHNDAAGMKAAAALAENMRLMGGTIGSNVTLQDAQEIVNNSNAKAAQSASSENVTSIGQLKEIDDVNSTKDHDQLVNALKAYYMSKKPDYWTDKDKEEAANEDIKDFTNLTNQQLYDRLHDLMANDENAQYYATLVQQPGFDSKEQWNSDDGYKQFVKVQGAQNEGPGGLLSAGMLFAAGIMKVFGPKYGKDTGNSTGSNATENQNKSTEKVTKVANMSDFLKNTPFGSAIKNALQKTSSQYDGQSIYKVTTKIDNPYLKKGDGIYLDALHKDHLEVVDSRGNVKAVLNIDGTLNVDKTKNAIGRKVDWK